jgi:choline dehydrogenase
VNLSSWSQEVSSRLNGAVSPEALEKRFRVQHDVMFSANATVAEIEFISVGALAGSVFWPTLPFSWGSVHLSAPGAINNPAIDVNFLAVDFDLQMAIGVGRLARQVWSTQPLSDIALSPISPGDSELPANATDSQWADYMIGSGKQNTNSNFLLGDALANFTA